MKKSAILALVLSIAAVLAFVYTSRAQELRRSGRGSGGLGPGISPSRAAELDAEKLRVSAELDVSHGDTIRTIVGQLGEAPDAEKAALMKKLEAAVATQFDRDMERRESELTQLEERFKKLRQQLDRRRRAKNEILDLQIKVLVNEAEGLGFGGDSSASESWYQLDPNANSLNSRLWYGGSVGPPGSVPPDMAPSPNRRDAPARLDEPAGAP